MYAWWSCLHFVVSLESTFLQWFWKLNDKTFLLNWEQDKKPFPPPRVYACSVAIVLHYFPHHRATPVSLSPVMWYTSLALWLQPNIPHNPTKMSYFSLSPVARKQCRVPFPQLYDSQNKVLSRNLKNMGFIFTSIPSPKATPVSLSSVIGCTSLGLVTPAKYTSQPKIN